MGYFSYSKEYRMYDKRLKLIEESIHIKFNKTGIYDEDPLMKTHEKQVVYEKVRIRVGHRIARGDYSS